MFFALDRAISAEVFSSLDLSGNIEQIAFHRQYLMDSLRCWLKKEAFYEVLAESIWGQLSNGLFINKMITVSLNDGHRIKTDAASFQEPIGIVLQLRFHTGDAIVWLTENGYDL